MTVTAVAKTDVEERSVTIATADGPMPAFVARPARAGAMPAAVLVQHIGGLSPTMKIVARRVAQLGVVCIVPSLYHRLGEIVVDPVDPDPAVAAIRAVAVASVTPPRLRMDMRATLGWLRGAPDVAPGPRGIIGFGGGAGQAMRLATEFFDEFPALVGILGVGFEKPGDPNSPHLGLGAFTGAAYFGFAGIDEIIPPAAVENLRMRLEATHVAHEIVVHPGVRHGYPFSDRAVYDHDAAEADWARVGDLFARLLSAVSSTEE